MRVTDRMRNSGRLGATIVQQLATTRTEIRHGRFQRIMVVMTIFAAIVTGFEALAQHLRGAFSQWLMWTPGLLTLPTMLVAAAGLFSERIARRVLPIVSLLWLVDGVVGFIYHLRGIARLPGGYKLGQYNVVMGPPIFAPLLACTVGILGLMGSMLRRGKALPLPQSANPTTTKTPRHQGTLRTIPWLSSWLFVSSWLRPTNRFLGRVLLPAEGHQPAIHPEALWLPRPMVRNVAYGRFQQGMALIAAFLGLLSGGEAYLEHLRGSFNQRFMWVPVWISVPMVAVGVLSATSRRVAGTLLPPVSVATFLVGVLGALLHLRGIKEMPGGPSTLRFSITLGPPAFAPLLFSATGLLGFIASLLQRRDD